MSARPVEPRGDLEGYQWVRAALGGAVYGERVRFAHGRWHTRHQGRYLIYAAEHPALVLCGLLVHDDGLAEVVLVGFVLRAPGLDEIPRRQNFLIRPHDLLVSLRVVSKERI